MYCTNGGKQLNADARFCPPCAYPTKNADTANGTSTSNPAPAANATVTPPAGPAGAPAPTPNPSPTPHTTNASAEATPSGSTLGILGLIIGILSCVLLFVAGPQAVLPAIAALVLCLVSLQKKEEGTSRAPAIVGLCFASFALFNAMAFFGCVSMMIGADNSLRLLGMPL